MISTVNTIDFADMTSKMLLSHFEPLIRNAERRAIVTVLRSHPEWTFGQVLEHLERGGPRSTVLRDLTIRELVTEPDTDVFELTIDNGPPINRSKLETAKRAQGEQFDAYVLEVITEAGGRPVAAGYVRARVGGPRWKLQASFRRLVHAGQLRRSGRTSATRYRVVEAAS